MNITDALNSVTPDTAARAAFRAVDALQDLPPAEQAAGISMLFLMLTRRFRVNGRDALAQAGRRIEDALAPNANDRPGDVARALRRYLKEEL